MHQQPAQPGYVPNQPPYGPPPGFPPAPPPRDRRPWHIRHRKLAIGLGVFAALLLIGGIGNAVGGSKPVAAVKPAPAVTRIVTVTATAKPRAAATRTVTEKATVTVTATAAAPAAAPAPASSAPAQSSGTVATFSGSGIKNTPQFTVTDTWKLEYSYDCSDAEGSGNFIVNEDNGNDYNGASVNELGAGGSSSTMVYGDAGTHYLSVNSECSWTVKVVDEG